MITLEGLLNRMFPGDPKSGLLSYAELNIAKIDPNDWSGVISAALTQLDNETISGEVNEIIKALKRLCPREMETFINKALENYFTHLEIIKVLQSGNATLFPNPRILPDINIELFEPLWERFQ